MAKTILAQVYPAINILTDAYSVKPRLAPIVNNIIITNQDPVSTTFSLSIALGGKPDDPKQYLFKNSEILANETIDLDFTDGLILNLADVIRVSSSNGDVSFSIFGLEQAT